MTRLRTAAIRPTDPRTVLLVVAVTALSLGAGTLRWAGRCGR